MIKKKFSVTLITCICAAALVLSGCSSSSGSAGSGSGGSAEIQKLIEGSLEYIRENTQTVDMYDQAEFAFETWIGHSDDVKKLSQRNDYAGPMMELYMDSELPPYEASDTAMDTFKEQELMEVFLSQSSACRQLNEGDRNKLVKRMISNAMARENKEAYVLNYSSAFFKNIEWQGSDNEWYDAMRSMELDSGEKRFLDKFYAECDNVQSMKQANGAN
ncbi:MAG: hypothetical protein NC223_08465 [Butyrivibrio sp.]|nr:hypothetical protein [Butyrivibrio sp.]